MYSPIEINELASYCSFCGLDLGTDSYFSCHLCGASFCHIHMSKHLNAHPAMASLLKTHLN